MNKIDYKRTIIQIPLDVVPLFEDYARSYSLSLSSAIVMLAKKSLEYEDVIRTLPSMFDYIIHDDEKEFNDIKSVKSKRLRKNSSNKAHKTKKV